MDAKQYYFEKIKAMCPFEKLHIAQELYNTACNIKRAALIADYPDWTPQQIKRAVHEWMWYSKS